MSTWRASVHHTHLMASDLEASLAFYRRWFDAVIATSSAKMRDWFELGDAGRLTRLGG